MKSSAIVGQDADGSPASTPRLIPELQRAAGPVALVLGPALSVIGFALHPLGQSDTTVFVARINAHPTLWALAHLLIGVGLAVFAAGVGSTLRLADGRGARCFVAGVTLSGVGAAAMGYEAVGHGAVGYALAGRPDVPLAVSVHVQDAFEHLGFSSATGFTSILFPLGLVLVGVGAIRCPRTPSWGGVLLLAAPFGIQIAGAGPVELVGAAPLVVGLATVARAALTGPPQPNANHGQCQRGEG